MELGIIGLPKSGKTTIFNALTRGNAETDAYSPAALTPNIGVVKVPDPRLDKLTDLFQPKRTVPAEITYIDIAMESRGIGKSQAIGGQFLAYLSKVDALVLVIRAFNDESVPHPDIIIDPERDMSTMKLEVAFSDLAIIERRLERLRASLKGAKPQERELIVREDALLTRIKNGLENDIPVREQELSERERKDIEGFQFLTAKPLLFLINIGEEQLPEATSIEGRFRNIFYTTHTEVAALCGKLEMEMTQLNDAEAQEFRSSVGLVESGLDRMIRLSYGLVGLVSFFTVGSDEVRAWPIHHNTTALKAAGKIHTDLERGFIRAEVIKYDDLVRCGGMAEGRKQGLLRLEGKSYIIQDGDIVTILFNV